MTRWMEPVDDASVWTGDDLTHDSSWAHNLSSQHQCELESALQHVNDRHLELSRIEREEFPLPTLSKMLETVQRELREGRGFVAIRGLPVLGRDLGDVEKLYWGLCSHLGTGVTQNSEAGLIHYVTDGNLRPRMGSRRVGRPGPVGLHVDLADCVALLCVRQAPGDPHSLVASSMTVYNEILRQHPEWMPRLREGFIWDRAEEQGPGETPVSDYRVPAFSEAGGKITCRFNPSWITRGIERIGKNLSDENEEIFAFIRETAAVNCFSFPLHSGDIAICNNYTVFHGRDGHNRVEEEAKKRILLRIWMDLSDVRSFADEARIRYGVIRHGKLGWTAADLLAGRHHTPHRRRQDGAPAV